VVTPYYQDESVCVYHGDCREVLPFLPKSDLLLTDPPYGIGRDGQKASTGSHGGRKPYEHLGWDDVRPPSWLIQMLLPQAAMHIVWGGNYFADVLPQGTKWLVWDKGQRIYQSDCELAWTSLIGAQRIYTLNRVALMTDGACHPTQKPEQLMRWCIEQADGQSVVGAVLDPFMGSGTTLVAAKRLGRKAIGIERELKYCELAVERLRQSALPLGMGA
jgi:site-specific DNA-methyltransferase (adenine-specific)